MKTGKYQGAGFIKGGSKNRTADESLGYVLSKWNYWDTSSKP